MQLGDLVTVVRDLDQARAARSAAQPGSTPAACACGCEWFALRGGPAAPDPDSAGFVTMTVNGSITGFAGQIVCSECGRENMPDVGAMIRG